MTDPTRPKLRSAAVAECRTASTAPPLITQKALDGVQDRILRRSRRGRTLIDGEDVLRGSLRSRDGHVDAVSSYEGFQIEANLVVGALFASGDDAEVDLRRRCRSDAEHDTRESGAPEPRAHTSFRHLPVSRWRAS